MYSAASGYAGKVVNSAASWLNTAVHNTLAKATSLFSKAIEVTHLDKVMENVVYGTNKYENILSSTYATTAKNVIKQMGASFITGTVITFVQDIMGGQSVQQSLAHSVVTSAASTAVAYTLMSGIVGVSTAITSFTSITAVAGVTSIAALPVAVAVGAFAVARFAVSLAYDNNFLGFKDFTDGIGNFIDGIF